ncbi:MAG: acyl-CoA thioesterase [Phycisphaerae bacterium]|nr:acyl-CoA thioesterase [Phycisphaerae bacterium]
MTNNQPETLALRVHMMPSHTNAFGTIFGGVILSLIDQAGFDEARKHGRHRWVTVAFQGVLFKEPVYTGDRVSLYTHTIKTGRSSVHIGVRVEALRYNSDEIIEVTSAELTMVSVDADGRSIESSSPPTLGHPERNHQS